MRRFVAAVVLGATTVVIYLALEGDGPANRVATCPVRISAECQALYPALRPYETLRFPVRRDVLADGGVQILLPKASRATQEGLRDCVEVMDWGDCDIDPCASHAAVCAAWIDSNPFTRVRTASKHVIPDCREADGGWNDNHAPVDCLGTGQFGAWDSGAPEWRGCGVLPRALSTGTQCLNAPSGTVFAGERLEDSL
jgi:hypothetical protein